MRKSGVRSRTAAVLLAVGIAAGGVATAAPASARTTACNIINIGQPGNVYWHGQYAGQVEQQYDNCGHVLAHWQWAGAFQAANPGAYLYVGLRSPYGYSNQWGSYGVNTKDVTVGWVDIHAVDPDAWIAMASVNGCNWAYGSEHWYGGADWAGPVNSSC
ncbi:hypothetical protein WN990_21395 [Kitasatospora purpeofusca]|uniref:hypothetical protein n=1 Tax=Kitasatospora purpeofusca TaxID=67352 RepID=UPI0030EFDDBF